MSDIQETSSPADTEASDAAEKKAPAKPRKKTTRKKAASKKTGTKKATSRKKAAAETDTSNEVTEAPVATESAPTDGAPEEKAAPAKQADAPEESAASDPENAPPRRRRRRNRRRRGGDGENGDSPRSQDEQREPREAEPEEALPEVIMTGVIELTRKSYARIRQLDDTYVATLDDPVLEEHLLERHGLRPGLMVEVSLGGKFSAGNRHEHESRGRGGKKKPKAPTMGSDTRRVDKVLAVEGRSIDEENPKGWSQGRTFEDLTIIMPEPRLELEHPGCAPAARLIDMFCPIGKGTRGMIVSPPKAGKTTLLQQIAYALHENHGKDNDNFEVYALLVDERPEEVTEFRRNVPVKVWASSNDHPPEKHVGLAVAAIERAKRQAELGKDVVVLLDSLTRLGRAFNVASNVASTGRTLSGGLDAGALAVPKQLFGAARNFEEGGSLTIIATALVETGSKGDEVIFEEFKGTGNMEIVLDRRIAEQRIYPAINLAASGTRNEQKLMSAKELDTMTQLRRRLLNMSPPAQVEQLLKALERYKTNTEMVGSAAG